MRKILILILLITAVFLIGVKVLIAPHGKIFERVEQDETQIAFLGDIIMDRSIRTTSESRGYDYMFECVAPYLRGFDYVVANMESPITSNDSISAGTIPGSPNNYRFTTSPKALLAILGAGINILGIDNNHMYDFGRSGVEETGKNILASGIKYFGDPINPEHTSLRVIDGKNIFTLVSFNEFFGSSEKTILEIQKAKMAGGIVVVFAHWGNEYVPATPRVREWARNFIDSGADAVIGMHPHVIQETDNYKGAFIAYSIGNFLFDQYFNNEVKTGAVVEMTMNNGKIVKIGMRKTSLDNFRRPCVN